MDETKVTLELDVAVTDDELGALLLEHAGDQPVAARLLALRGPGGGNPLVALTGTRSALQAWLLAEYVDGDEAEAERLLATATPAGE